MYLHWVEKSSIGIFLVNFQKWSEQLYDGKLSTAHDSGCFRLYVSQTTVTSNFCSTKVYIYILSFFFSTKSIWNTETKSSQIFNYTQVTIGDVKPSVSHYGKENAQISNFLVDKYKTLLYLEKDRSPITFCRLSWKNV